MMEIGEIVRLVLLPFGGVSVALVAMVGWLAHLSTKRIVNSELANHKLQLESFKSESSKELQHVKDSGSKEIEALKQQYMADIERIKTQLQSEFLRYETYTMISKKSTKGCFPGESRSTKDF